MHKSIQSIFSLLALAFVFLLTSCHTSRKVVGSQTGGKSAQACFESVVAGTFKYEALQSKVKYSLGSSSLSGKLCLESGQRLCLQVNAPIVGFEVARVEASQDSVLLVDKYDKLYTVLHLADLYQIAEISGGEMEALECIMLGRIYIPGKGQATNRDFKSLIWSTPTQSDGTPGNVEGRYQGKDFTLCYTIDGSGLLVSTQLIVGGKSALWEYASYTDAGKGRMIPTRETITATNADQQSIQATLVLNNPELGESSWRDFEPTASYRQVNLDELTGTIKQLVK